MISNIKQFLNNHIARVNQNPIIVFGKQKSGTSAIAHLLADYGGLSKTIDIPALWGVEMINMLQGKRVFSEIVKENKHYFSKDLIKEPNMTFFMDQVIKYFPNANYIFIIRDPRDSIRSSLNRRNIPGNLKELKIKHIKHLNYRASRILNMPETWGGKPGNYIDAQANKWNVAANNYLRFRDKIILVKYEDFISDKLYSIINLAKKLGIEKVNDISNKVDIQYQPKGDHNISWEDFYGTDNLRRIEGICRKNMKIFNYII